MNSVIKAIEEEKIIVIVRGVQKEKLIPFAEAVYAGGIRLLELTYNAKGNPADEETAENIRMLVEHFAGRMYIGAGTVLTEKQVELTKAAGGRFIISPDVYPEVIKKTKELGMVSLPGAITPTEMQIAHRAGADFIKLFPMANFGVSYLKNIKAPLSHLKILAVGGVDENNIADYVKAGAVGFGLGSNIVKKDLIEKGAYAEITECAKRYVEKVK